MQGASDNLNIKQDKDNVLDKVKGFAFSDEIPLKKDIIIDINRLSNDAFNNTSALCYGKDENNKSNNYYSELIERLDEIRDTSNGIVQYKMKLNDSDNGQKLLIRDARGEGINIGVNTDKISYLIQIANITRAADRILRNEDQGSYAEELRDSMKNYVSKYIQEGFEDKIDAKEYNTKLISALKNIGIKDVEKKLILAKDLCVIEDTQYHTATIFQQERISGWNVDIATIDIKCFNSMTKAQKAQCNQIGKSKGNQIKKKQGLDEEYKWYNDQPEWSRKLITQYSNEIQNKMLSSQLRKNLIGLRNVANRVVIQQVGSQNQIVVDGIRCSTVGFDGKGDANKIATENVKQLKAINDNLYGKESKLNITTLNTPFIKETEKNAVNHLSNAVNKIKQEEKDSNLSYAVTPINVIRFFGKSKYEAFNNDLKALGKNLKDNRGVKDIAEFLQGKGNYKKAKKSIAGCYMQDSESAVILAYAVQAKQNMKSNFISRWWNKKNIDTTAYMVAISSAINNGALLNYVDEKFKLSNQAIYCASGKDRTGLTYLEAEHLGISASLGIMPKEIQQRQQNEINEETVELADKNLMLQIKSGHTHRVPDENTPGAYGLVRATRMAAPVRYDQEKKDLIFRKTASFNKLRYITQGLKQIVSRLFGLVKEIEPLFKKIEVKQGSSTRAISGGSIDSCEKSKLGENNQDNQGKNQYQEVASKQGSSTRAINSSFVEKIRSQSLSGLDKNNQNNQRKKSI